MIKKTRALIERHFAEASTKYRGLSISFCDEGATISGVLDFDTIPNRVRLVDSYNVEIIVPKNYPKVPPKAREIGGRIPSDFHTNPDGFACLTTPLEIMRQFSKQPDLIGFIEHLLIPYLYGYTHLMEYNFLPFGEFDHGDEGKRQSFAEILSNYKILFSVDEDSEVLSLLRVLAEDNYRGHHKCPCGSLKKLRDCHGPALLEIKGNHPVSYFFEEYFYLLLHVHGEPEKWQKQIINDRFLKIFKKVAASK